LGFQGLSTKTDEQEQIKKMADLLRQGETLTGLACPVCHTPLFRLKKRDLWCTKCEKKVLVIREGEETSKITNAMTLERIESTLLGKIGEIQDKMQKTENIEEIQKLSITLSELLETLEKTRRNKET
jgi:UPF0148 protein